MSVSTIASIIAVTYAGLLLLWIFTLPLARRAAGKRTATQIPDPESSPPVRRSILSSAGSLGVFLANIVAMAWFLLSAASPDAARSLESVRNPLPPALHLVGALLFILNGVWGWLVLFFNPGYTPFFLNGKRRIVLATQGPYAVIRHPRYASEAALNVILFLFTGSWIPLLGILGWVAIRRQAIREEEFLLRAAPEAYERYMAVTGRFLPRWKFRKEE